MLSPSSQQMHLCLNTLAFSLLGQWLNSGKYGFEVSTPVPVFLPPPCREHEGGDVGFVVVDASGSDWCWCQCMSQLAEVVLLSN